MVDERMKIVIIAFLVFIAVAEGIALAVGYLIDSWDGSATGSDIMRWAKRDTEPLLSPRGQ